jgi:hypothetical protein
MIENKNKYERAISELFSKYCNVREVLFLKDNPFQFAVGEKYGKYLVIDRKLTRDVSEEPYIDNVADIEPLYVKQYEVFDTEMKIKDWFNEDKLEIIPR